MHLDPDFVEHLLASIIKLSRLTFVGEDEAIDEAVLTKLTRLMEETKLPAEVRDDLVRRFSRLAKETTCR